MQPDQIAAWRIGSDTATIPIRSWDPSHAQWNDICPVSLLGPDANGRLQPNALQSAPAAAATAAAATANVYFPGHGG